MPEPRAEPRDPLDELRGFWKERYQGLVSGSIDSLEGAAKQIIAIVSVLAGLYFHALVFPTTDGWSIKTVVEIYWWQGIVYVLPVVLWIASLFCAILTLSPPYKGRRMSMATWQDAKRAFEIVERRKRRWLVRSQVLLLISLALLLLVLIVYLAT